jgi:hypothetical protein
MSMASTVQSSSIYVAQLCRGGTCTDPMFPLLDYDEDAKTCICRSHPCWSDRGKTHSCPTEEFPFLHFNYDADQSLSCNCSHVPQYDSLHIAKNKCPGHFCASESFAILDWAPTEEKCHCRSHPCLGEADAPECPPEKPILRYRLDVGEDGEDLPVCECVAKLESPALRALRGAPEPPPKVCVFVTQAEREHRRQQ